MKVYCTSACCIPMLIRMAATKSTVVWVRIFFHQKIWGVTQLQKIIVGSLEDDKAEDIVTLDLEGYGGLEGADVAGVDAEGFAGGEVFDDDFA